MLILQTNLTCKAGSNSWVCPPNSNNSSSNSNRAAGAFVVQLPALAVIRATVEVTMVEATVIMQVKQVPIALAITGALVEPVEFLVPSVVAQAVPVLGRRVPIQSGLLRRLIVI